MYLLNVGKHEQNCWNGIFFRRKHRVIISLFSKSISLDFKWGNIWGRVLFSDYWCRTKCCTEMAGKTQLKNANRINEKKMTENQTQGMERLKDQRLQAFLISLICASSSPSSCLWPEISRSIPFWMISQFLKCIWRRTDCQEKHCWRCTGVVFKNTVFYLHRIWEVFFFKTKGRRQFALFIHILFHFFKTNHGSYTVYLCD